jgi:NAD(P)-dependent dehydrogenase (short-subunit alcohol dehydrogenase family)
MKKLEGKIAIVTGGSRGIGKAIVTQFLANGASVMIVARSNSELMKTKAELAKGGGNVEVFPADVSKKIDVRALIKTTMHTFGTIDVVVNAAGVYGVIGAASEVDFDKWKEAFNVNLFGTFNMIQEIVPVFEKKRRGKIINFSGGGDGPLPHFSAYSASKAAVVRLTETLAQEVKDSNIDVNAVAPGPVNTKFLEVALDAGEALVGKELYAKLVKQKEEGGVAPEKAAALCVFLASNDSDGLSGKLVSAVWDKWSAWTKDDIARMMEGNKLTLRRVNL